MPGGTWRIAGPPVSTDFRKYIENNDESPRHFLKNGARFDGRNSGSVRPIFLDTGPIFPSRGSSIVELGQTKVICAVYGPKQIVKREDFSLIGQLVCDFKFSSFSGESHLENQQATAEERDLASQIIQSLESVVKLEEFPKAQLEIFITVLENDGSVLPASMTAASLAIADAGIGMYDLCAGASLRMYNGTCFLDPTSLEESMTNNTTDKVESDGVMTVAYMPSLRQVSMVCQKGSLSVEDSKKSLRTLMKLGEDICELQKDCLAKSAIRKSNSH